MSANPGHINCTYIVFKDLIKKKKPDELNTTITTLLSQLICTTPLKSSVTFLDFSQFFRVWNLQGPEVQVELLRLQVLYHGSCRTAVWRSKPWRGVWRGQNVVDAEFDLRLGFAEWRVALIHSVIWTLWTKGIRMKRPPRGVLLRVHGAEGFRRLPEAQT